MTARANNLPIACVVDANVAIKLFINQPDSDVARELFASLAATPAARFHVPDFFYAECVNVLANYARLAKYPVRMARQNMSLLIELGLRAAPTAPLSPLALDIAMAFRISGYDACYVALSRQLGVPLITADEKLVKAMGGQPYQVRSLAEWR
jgi:predicted nucleic acid-binding protein